MTSRRTMTRSFSGNGRTSSFSEDEGNFSSGRSEGRNTYLSNVRPENSYSRYSHYRPTRSTLCSVMAQLTEDIQPSFETTLKSKAVSENCNVKFTCVVSGYPTPELKWYKDDMEMDRYCGLPKYEIRRNGKTHTLHIFNCTLDDAAIYQVSASNSKGIVSCSGVLEVGTMNEYKIHQRFFAKLKQKAEKKKKDLDDQSNKANKENIQKKEPERSPDPLQRKRSIPPPVEITAVDTSAAEEQPGDNGAPNGISPEVKKVDASPENITPVPGETLAKKRVKISREEDVRPPESSNWKGSGKSHLMGNGGENSYDGGIGLAQFLSETLQSQSAEEKQVLAEEEMPASMETSIVKDPKPQDGLKQPDVPQEDRGEEEERKELTIEAERPVDAAYPIVHGKQTPSKNQSKSQKDHDHHHIPASISSMFHSVKDFFFGKNKKDSHSYVENEDKDFNDSTPLVHPIQMITSPSINLQTEQHHLQKDTREQLDNAGHVPEALVEEQQLVSMERHTHENKDNNLPTEHKKVVCNPAPQAAAPDGVNDLAGASLSLDKEQISAPLDPLRPRCEDCSTLMDGTFKMLPTSTEDIIKTSVAQTNSNFKDQDVSVEQRNRNPMKDTTLVDPSPHAEVEEKHSQPVPVIEEFVPQETRPGTEDIVQRGNRSEPQHVRALPCPPKCATPDSDYQTPPESLLLVTDVRNSKEALVETENNYLRADMLGVGEGLNKVTSHLDSTVSGEGKSEVNFTKHLLPNIGGSETIEKLVFSVEKRLKVDPDQTISPFSLEVTTPSHPNQDANHVPRTEGTNKDLLKNVNMKNVNDISQPMNEEVRQDTKKKTVQKPNAFATHSTEGFMLRDELDCKAVKENDLRMERKHLQHKLETESETRVEKEMCDKSRKTLILKNSETTDKCLSSNVSHLSVDKSKKDQNTLEKIPIIQISSSEHISDIDPAVKDFNQREPVDLDVKENNLPLTILALSKLESNELHEYELTHQSNKKSQGDKKASSPVTLSTKINRNLSPTQKRKEIAQALPEHQEPPVQSNEQLQPIDKPTIPVITVICTDNKENDALSNAGLMIEQSPEISTAPLIVVPPISVTCHESDFEHQLPTSLESETFADMQRGTKSVDDATEAEVTQQKQSCADMTDKRTKVNTPVALPDSSPSKVSGSIQSVIKPAEEHVVFDSFQSKFKEVKTEIPQSVEDFLKSKPSIERLSSKPPTYPSLSPSSLRKFMMKPSTDSDNDSTNSAPAMSVGDPQNDKTEEDFSGGSTPTSSLSCESSPRLKRRDSLTLIRSATPEELASGARRKIFIPKAKDEIEGTMLGLFESKKESPFMSPSQIRRAALLQPSTGQKTPPVERRSPLLSRRKATLDIPKVAEEVPAGDPVTPKIEEKPAEKKLDPLKAPQVIRKIRGEPFPDASGHLKLWCQFFNVLSDSTIKWYRDDEEILEIKRSGGDESQVALAIVLASDQDCGVYGCTISNEYGSDTTDFLLSADVLSEILLKDDMEAVGEEIEMTPLLFSRGLADTGSWGEKYFGRILVEMLHIGGGCMHKASRVKVIYGLDPVFESGSACMIKVRNPIAYGTKQESNLTERNLEIVKQECKVQNLIREYCKIFSAEARVIENFGCSLEVIPKYLMYRPANSVPYASVEADLTGEFVKYGTMDSKGHLITLDSSEIEQKCCTFQHWIHQWTHGNLLITHLEGVETKITNIKVVTKSKGYQGLTDCGSPEVLEQFLGHHQCNYYCGLFGLRPLKTMDSLQQPSKIKGSRSPLLNRKLSSGSPQSQRKGFSPQISRKASSSPKVTKKNQETEPAKTAGEIKLAETISVTEMR